MHKFIEITNEGGETIRTYMHHIIKSTIAVETDRIKYSRNGFSGQKCC